MRTSLCWLTLISLACHGPESSIKEKGDSDREADTDTDTDADTDTDTGDGDIFPDGPCADGGWGKITEPANSIHISAGAVTLRDEWSDTPGSPGNPLTSVAEISPDTSGMTDTLIAVAFWPGEYSLDPSTLTNIYASGLRIEACGGDESRLDLEPPIDQDGPLIVIEGSMDTLGESASHMTGLTISTSTAFPILSLNSSSGVRLTDVHLTGANLSTLLQIDDSTGVAITDSTLSGGQHALSILNSDVTLSSINIQDSTIAGIWATGPVSSITMDQVLVQDTTPGVGFSTPVGGWGIFVEAESFIATNVTVSGAIGVGLMTDVSTLSLTDVTISDVSADGEGLYGRGIQLMDTDSASPSSAVLSNVRVEDTADAGLFIQEVTETLISDLKVGHTGLSIVPDTQGGGTAGDALVITGRGPDTAMLYSESPGMVVRITDRLHLRDPARASIIVDNARLAIDATTLIEGVLLEDDPLTYIQNGGESSGAVLFTDLGIGEISEPTVVPYGESPLCLNLGKPSLSTSSGPVVTSTLGCGPF